MLTLPKDLHCHILSFLPPRAVYNWACTHQDAVCMEFHQFVPLFWRVLGNDFQTFLLMRDARRADFATFHVWVRWHVTHRELFFIASLPRRSRYGSLRRRHLKFAFLSVLDYPTDTALEFWTRICVHPLLIKRLHATILPFLLYGTSHSNPKSLPSTSGERILRVMYPAVSIEYTDNPLAALRQHFRAVICTNPLLLQSVISNDALFAAVVRDLKSQYSIGLVQTMAQHALQCTQNALMGGHRTYAPRTLGLFEQLFALAQFNPNLLHTQVLKRNAKAYYSRVSINNNK